MGKNDFIKSLVYDLVNDKIEIKDFVMFGYYNNDILHGVIKNLYKNGYSELLDKILIEHCRNYFEYLLTLNE